ncbi:Protein kinase, ATP binding site-containing protein [Artemisia annua]|uniref:Protein kinase, ATP binding site-containing protein n=1 Tax=Artemisia annua TaxID=35608 RepID=A0A2U1M0K8_ARTAN|nr:Protein kinase, ATP binding site-containing protein [Artemisia annua]
MSSSGLHLEDFRIPLEEIILATKNFSRETLIGAGGFSIIYKGKFSERLQNRTAAIKRHTHDGYQGKNEFLNQLKLLITFQHENITPFIGYCDEGDEMITVIEYAINGSLDYHLKNTIKRRELTWVQRLKICIGVARGLNYLHSGLGEDKIVIHRMINSGSILLDENMEAKITGFSLLISVPRDQPKVYEPSAAGIWCYLDPIYHESGILKADADVYSFGIVLFEILTGMSAHDTKEIGDAKPQHMINLVRRYYDDGLDKLIDPFIKDQIVRRSLLTFEEMAYKCISFNTKDRPTMDKIIKTTEEALNIQNRRTASAITIRAHQYQNLQKFIFPLEMIKSATYNFSPEFLIKDGFTNVYRGEIFVGFQLHVVAFKRYDPNSDRENEEFRNELEVISRSQHENIIPFIGFCDEGGEMIIIYEYAVNGSLKRHLQDPDRRRCITWAQRLKICIGAATGLSYLHSGVGYERDKVIHRNFKSGKILLGHNLEAKISGFDMSILVPKDQRQVYEPVEGTQFYIDPIYQECGILQTESDTYSFGMVLFEILSGMLAYHKRSIGVEQPQNLRNLVRRYYDDGPENLIDPLIRDQIDDRSFRLFTEIAYKCMSFNMEDRPSMKRVIKRIKEALDIQVSFFLFDYSFSYTHKHWRYHQGSQVFVHKTPTDAIHRGGQGNSVTRSKTLSFVPKT